MMKKVFLLPLFLLTFCSIAQVKKANTIIITMPDSTEKLYKLAYKVLFDNNYTIVSSDKELLYFSTDYKTIKLVKTKISISINENQIIIKGNFIAPAISNDPSTIDFRGMSGSPSMNAWEEMDKIAKQFNGVITYELR